ncbi:uncharacterized protein TNCV_4494691 [Trichonephila clavipes]|nr:uncharacterized protein TNCV_4494691 [Trichonephila clavipes]
MEPVGAYRPFERSRETRKLEYVEFYGDDDSKNHLAVKDIYGIDSNYYGIAIRSNIGNSEEMQRAVIAAFYHCCSGLLSVLESLDIKIGSYTLRGYAAIDQTRIEDSIRHSLPSAKVKRKKIRAIKKRKVVNTEKHEGVTYKSGAF